MLNFVRERVLTLDFLMTVKMELEEAFSRQEPALGETMKGSRKKREEMDRSIKILRDLAE